MKWNELTRYWDMDETLKEKLADLNIKGIAYDSRKVEKDYLFVAIEGYKTDGHSFVGSALEKGASCVVVEKDRYSEFRNTSYADKIIPIENTRKALALCSKAFFNNPDSKMKVIGVTGTNGKTSITYMVREIALAAGEKCGVIGTIACYVGDKKTKTANTTPESYEIYRLMSEMVEAGCSVCVMEVSSHALVLNRVEGMDFDVVIFTNLSEDHLDFHKDMQDYLNAKMLIIPALLKSNKKEKIALLNSNSSVFNDFQIYAQKLHAPHRTYGIKNNSFYSAENIQMTRESNSFDVKLGDTHSHFHLGLLGDFNISNALSVIGAMDFLGYPAEMIVSGLEKVSVPGRFQNVPTTLPFTVIVDYAHTDDALHNVLMTMRKLNPRRILCLFGCGGDRETGKRYLMGEISGKYADLTFITSDNPRTEDPERILDMIEEGVRRVNGKYLRILNREQAIERVIEEAGENDLVLIAGKGHEDYQILKDRTIHFDDTETAEKYLRKREKSEQK